MNVSLFRYQNNEVWSNIGQLPEHSAEAALLLGFGSRGQLCNGLYERLRQQFPAAEIVLASSAGEIYHTEVFEESAIVTALSFSSTRVATNAVTIHSFPDSRSAGEALLRPFLVHELPVHVLVFSDGTLVNGSELVKGLQEAAAGRFAVTGGLAGDGSAFRTTAIGLNGEPVSGQIVAVAFFGNALRVSHGVKGGWTSFGTMLAVTKSQGNILYEIDNKKALDVYKEVLGEKAAGLPEAALLFPLSVNLPGSRQPLVRTILSIDEANGSMTFAGDIPEGLFVRFMQANLDKITDAASVAAVETNPFGNPHTFALLISCVGRKLVLGNLANREIKAVDAIFDHRTVLSGFYSYGELSPLSEDTTCQLHNQTMTITAFSEDERVL